uniref:Protein-tyrosine-phosphatase n=1 Tax=Panagrolaimus sp. ES5 TaxID=591445 RepID=A0AC34FF74_9BILA
MSKKQEENRRGFATETQYFTISEIRPHLPVTGYGLLSDEKIRDLGYTHAVDATNKFKIHMIKDVTYFNVRVEDGSIDDIKRYFKDATDFIQDAIQKGGKVLVFCRQGISRSVTICLMYLVIKEHFTLREAFIEIDKIRSFISPNLGFWTQMIEYENKIYGEASVKILAEEKVPIPDVYLYKDLLLKS